MKFHLMCQCNTQKSVANWRSPLNAVRYNLRSIGRACCPFKRCLKVADWKVLHGALNLLVIFTQTVHSLAKHIVTQHTDATPNYYRPFDCDLCERKFTSTSSMRRHKILNHNTTEPTRLNCDSCEASFATADALEFHNNSVHTNQKPHRLDTR